jgi:hypothetical protein
MNIKSLIIFLVMVLFLMPIHIFNDSNLLSVAFADDDYFDRFYVYGRD